MRTRRTRWIWMTAGLVLALAGGAWAAGLAGDLDGDFGSDGVEVVRTLPFVATAYERRADVACATVGTTEFTVLARQVDSSTSGTRQWVITRHLADGGLDSAFGSGGQVTLFGNAGDSHPRAIAMDPNGKILAVGQAAEKGKGKRIKVRRVLLRLNTNGSLDNSFGTGGIVDTGKTYATSLALEATSNGYEVLVAVEESVSVTTSGGGKGKKKKGSTSSSTAFGVLRYDDTGSLLDSFSDDFGDTNDEHPQEIAVDSLGRILVSGSHKVGTGTYERTICRYSSTGSLDTSFGSSGRFHVTDSAGGELSQFYMAVDSEDRVAVSGYSEAAGGVVLRIDDATATSLPIPYDWTFEEAYAGYVAVDSSDRVIVCNWVEDAAGDYGVAVVRYTSSGSLDVGFGPNTDGVSEWFDEGDRDRWGPIAVDANGDIVGACFGADSSDLSTVSDVLVRWLGS